MVGVQGAVGKRQDMEQGRERLRASDAFIKVLNVSWNLQGVIKDGKKGSRGMRFVFSRDTRAKVDLRLGQTRKRTH